MGMALLKLNRVSEAMGCFDEATRLGLNDKDLWTSKAKASEATGNKEEAVRSYMKALEIDPEDQAAWYRLGLLHLELERFADADSCFDRSLDIESSNAKIWMSKGFAMEKQEMYEEAVSSYDRAIGLDSNDKEAWNAKAQVMLKLGRPEQALRCYDHALSIDPYFQAASDGRKHAEDEIRRTKIEEYSRRVLDFEYTHGRPVTKEEAFKVCGIPYAFLGEVLEYLSGKEELSLSGMNKQDFERFEKMSREILVNTMEKRDLAEFGLRLCDISVNFPELKISSAKRILSYIQTVEEHEFGTRATDPQTDTFLRQALDLPDDQKNVLGIIRNLGVGVYQARQLVTILLTFQGGGFETPSIKIKSIVGEGYGQYSPFEERQARGHRYAGQEEQPEERGREEEAPRFGPPPARKRREQPHEEERRPRERSRREPEAKKEEEVPSDLIGRRCLFHGGVAVARCGKCKAILCKECIRGSDRCPRCNAPLKGEEEPTEKRRPRPPSDEEPAEDEAVSEEEEQEQRPSRKPPRKKEESKAEDLKRL